jgi:hypothetical protein
MPKEGAAGIGVNASSLNDFTRGTKNTRKTGLKKIHYRRNKRLLERMDTIAIVGILMIALP